MANYDASSTNKSKKSTRTYVDLDLDFTRHPITNDVVKITDVEAVKRSVRNLINLNHYEKPFHPEIGSNLRAMLFELMTPQMNHLISKQIQKLITNYEPRARLVQVATVPDFDRNAYNCKIFFYVINQPEPVTVETFLERLR